MVKRHVQGTEEPKDMTHLRRNGLTWYARFTVPKDRWADVGRREVVRTLRTRDLKEARRHLGPALEEIRRQVDQGLIARGLRPLSGGWVPPWGGSRDIVAHALRARASLERASNEALYDEEGVEQGSDMDMVRGLVLEEAEQVANRHGDEAFRAFYDIATGTRTPITAMAERWLAAETPRLRKATVLQHRTALRRFGEFLAQDAGARRRGAKGGPEDMLAAVGMETITKDQASRFLEGLEQQHGLAPKTIARLHSSLSMLWKWAGKRDVVPSNVWQGLTEGLKAKDRRRKIERGAERPYTDDEAEKLLRADTTVRRWSYGAAIWDLLRLALLTGARANELCSLRVRDVTRNGAGILIDESVAKTGNSVREVPLHHLAQVVIKARLAGLPGPVGPDSPLFPDCPLGGPDAKRSWVVGKRFTVFRRDVLGEDDTVDFHSLRRTFATYAELAAAGGVSAITENILADLMGHKRPSLAGQVYTAKTLPWDLKVQAIEGMVAVGMPTEVRSALEETTGSRPALPKKVIEGAKRAVRRIPRKRQERIS